MYYSCVFCSIVRLIAVLSYQGCLTFIFDMLTTFWFALTGMYIVIAQILRSIVSFFAKLAEVNFDCQYKFPVHILFLKVFGIKWPTFLSLPQSGMDFGNKIWEALLFVGKYLYAFVVSGASCVWAFKKGRKLCTCGDRVYQVSTFSIYIRPVLYIVITPLSSPNIFSPPL